MKIFPTLDEPPLRKKIKHIKNHLNKYLGEFRQFIFALLSDTETIYLKSCSGITIIFLLLVIISPTKGYAREDNFETFNDLNKVAAPILGTIARPISLSPDSNLNQTVFVLQKQYNARHFACRYKKTKYFVKNGDTLSFIARKYNLSEETIQFSNHIDNKNMIIKGQELNILPKNLSLPEINHIQSISFKTQPIHTNYAFYRNTITRGDYRFTFTGLNIPIKNHNGISQYLTRYHHGIDYMANIATPIYAAASGYVNIAAPYGWNHGYGSTILINHGSGRTTRYGHLSHLYVTAGQWIKQGQIIGLTGNTGKSTGPHLHFEYRIYNVPHYPY